MPRKTYKVCIIGLTGIGAGTPLEPGENGLGTVVPSSHARAYAFLPETELVGVCDLKSELIEDFKTAWADEFPDLKGYTDYQQMISECKPDILSVVTSDNRHADIAVHAADIGIKGIFCEKPLATSLSDADRMITALETNGTVTNINHTRRWLPQYRLAKQELDAGTIGQVGRIIVHFGGPRAILFRNGTHMIDMVCYLAGSDVDWVFAELDDGYENYWPYCGDGGRNPDLEPGCLGYIHFKNGIRAVYNGSKGMSPETGFHVVGSAGSLWVNEDGVTVTTEAGKRRLKCDHVTVSNAASAIREIISGLEEGTSVISPPREARKTLEVILGFLASQKRGNTRIDFPLDEDSV